ncbi:YebC/PmpR family DNA-binding transcriptional regulator [Haliovirga abyssi]|uniref:Probable transcriptional regulatory protein HLVA_04960 n=1 Tax=Haliovirga abyssi TaxID=2996794 RepID=A0AAU9DEY8_9FUSO|nr:YebC/PmpR family DNA-binding transcriptional regulator [Haliovirga abyssi]BDU49927.1 putative transcriptional regulatory protein [Haliovirga abyssi]
MSGHSKWANIQHRKGRQDAKRGKMFTKMAKELTIAAKEAGGNIEFNPRLRLAVDKAKGANMPKDNIERAIKKGTGELEGVEYLEIRYEGYGPAGVAIIVDAVTDNKNRTASSVRSIFSKSGGNLGETGVVGWMFDRKGVITFDASKVTEDEVMEVALDAGAEDVVTEETEITVLTEPDDYENVKKAIDDAGLKYEDAELTFHPQNTVDVTDEENATKVLKLIDKLEEDDDVQEVYSNFNISDELLEKIVF